MTQRIAYMDKLGYLYCVTCRAKGYGLPDARQMSISVYDRDRCDGCRCPIRNSIENQHRPA